MELSENGSAQSVTPRALRVNKFNSFFIPEPIGVDENIINFFEELMRQTWTIYGISNLFGFKDSDLHLKLYAKKLKEEVSNHSSHENVTYDANFLTYDTIPALKIQVNTKSVGIEKAEEKIIYNGILLYWGDESERYNNGNVTKLPLLLCRGTRNCTEIVHNTLSCLFDCVIIALHAKEDDLMWLIPIAIAHKKEEEISSQSELRLEYTIPDLPVTDTVGITFRTINLFQVLAVIMKSDIDGSTSQNILKIQHVEKFHKSIHAKVYKMTSIQLGLCTLHRISLPDVTIMGNKMKVLDGNTLNCILLYLNKKALDALHKFRFVTDI